MIRPGSTLGILGGGQLGRMIAEQARRMGYRVAVMDPDAECSARRYADVFVQGGFGDAGAAEEVARASDVVTLETEHIPAEILRRVEKIAPLHPSAEALATVQDRLLQKEFLEKRGLPQPAFRRVNGPGDVEGAFAAFGGEPVVVKTRRGGYDGRGQAVVRTAEDALAAWEALGARPCIAESFVPFKAEVSVVLARAASGAVAHWPLAENVHRRGILHTTRAPARVTKEVAAEARKIAESVAEGLGHRGVLAAEMFLLEDGRLFVNEIAPRVHNSGHYTLGASATSQFEQHARAVLGLPLGDPRLLTPAVMLNLLGDLWARGEPDWGAVLAEPGAHLHLYGKRDVRPGRKMGHVTFLHEDADAAAAAAERAFSALAGEVSDAPRPPGAGGP